MTFLSTAAPGRRRAELQVFNIQLRNLRDPRTGVVHGCEQHSITVTAPGRAIRSLKESGHLFARDIGHRPSVEALDRNGKRG